MSAGLMPKPAMALVKAGFDSLVSVRGATWDRLLEIPGVGPSSLGVIEVVLGEPLPRERPGRKSPPVAPWPEKLWRMRGVPTEAAITFAQIEMTVGRLQGMSREELLSLPGVGVGAVRACELILGRAIPLRKVDDGTRG